MKWIYQCYLIIFYKFNWRLHRTFFILSFSFYFIWFPFILNTTRFCFWPIVSFIMFGFVLTTDVFFTDFISIVAFFFCYVFLLCRTLYFGVISIFFIFMFFSFSIIVAQILFRDVVNSTKLIKVEERRITTIKIKLTSYLRWLVGKISVY